MGPPCMTAREEAAGGFIEDEDDGLFELEELDLEEEDDDAPETKRRAHEFRPIFVLPIGSFTTEDEIKVWTDSKVATFSEDGSTVTTGQSYEQRGEAASVEEQKCSFRLLEVLFII